MVSISNFSKNFRVTPKVLKIMGVFMNDTANNILHISVHVSVDDNPVCSGVIHTIRIVMVPLSQDPEAKLGLLSFFPHVCFAPQYGFAYHTSNGGGCKNICRSG